MFSIGFGEVLVIAVVGFIVIGPKKLPEFMRTIAGWYRQFVNLRDEIRYNLIEDNNEEKKTTLKTPLVSIEQKDSHE